jgi:nicotinate-nucleotide adenylyltransferase
MEIGRGGLSYTVDTLEELSAKNEGADLVLLIGMDSAATFGRWVRPERIQELARIAVLMRAGDAERSELKKKSEVRLPAGATVVTTRRIDVSSSEIRGRAASGRSIKGFVAESVESFILAAKLYTP